MKTIRKNICLVTLPEIPAEKLMEYSNVLKLCKLLEDGLPKEKFEDTLFVFANTTGARYYQFEDVVMEVDTDGYKHRTLILFGEETGAVPSDTLLKKYDVTFKAHLRKEYAEKNLVSIPLFLPDEVLESDIVPFEKRKYNVFFSGNLNRNRVSLYVEINKRSAWWEKLLLPFYVNRGGGDCLVMFIEGRVSTFLIK